MKIISPTGRKLLFNNKKVEYVSGVPSKITIQGHTYNVVKVGNQYWINENLNADITQNTYHYQNYGAYYTVQEINEGIPQLLQSLGLTGWHVPTITETNEMIDYIVQQEGLSSRNEVGKYLLRTDQAGSIGDTYGLGFLLTGSYDGRSSWERVTEAGNYSDMGEQSDDNTYMNRMYFSTNATAVDTWGNGREAITRKYCTRLIYVE